MTCATERVFLGDVREQIVKGCVADTRCEGLIYQGSGYKWNCLNGDWLYKAL